VTKLLWRDKLPLLLASTSKTRLTLLQDISLPVETQGADVDERIIEADLQKNGADPVQVALALARAKACEVAEKQPGRWVVGADQTLALGDEQFHKPTSMEGARHHLRRLRGKTHQLHSAIVCMNGGREVFAHVDSAHLTMRNFGDDFLEAYLVAAGSVVMQSVGAYQLEGLGIHLFDKIEGDHSTILGLPLLPLLAFFRQAGLVEA
jgi:septum formation protein